jgi:tRNA (guanosine-2'-O-)-methyltransferase
MRRAVRETIDPFRSHELPADPASVIAALDPLLTAERRSRIDAVLSARSRAVVAVLDGVLDPHNISAVLRSADAFGVQEVHIITRGDRFLASPKVSQGADRWLDVVKHATARACVTALHQRGHRVYVACMAGTLRPETLADEAKPAIVFGNEHAGVSDELRELADGTYAVPMQGFVQSLNVSVAAGITLFEAMRGRRGDLQASDREHLQARYCLLSVPRADEVVGEFLRRRAR